MHENSMILMKEFVDQYVPESVVVLDIGSADINGTYRSLFPNRKYIGVDLTLGLNVDVIINSKEWNELKDVDVVISGQTLEHVADIPKFLNTLFNVLKNDGLICMIAPSAGPAHEFPIWVGHFSKSKMSKIMTDAGFEIISCISSDVEIWKDTCCIAKKPIKKQIEKKTSERIVKFNETK